MPKLHRNLNGYVTQYSPNHPREMKGTGYNGYVYQHILVAEGMLGRPLRAGEVVHHINHVRDDNRHQNLVVFASQSCHSKVHRWMDYLSSGSERSKESLKRISSTKNRKIKNTTKVPNNTTHSLGPLRACQVCGVSLAPNHKKFCSNKCAGTHRVKNRKIPKPSKTQLAKDMETLSWVAIGKKYGVSDNGARRWAKSYGLTVVKTKNRVAAEDRPPLPTKEEMEALREDHSWVAIAEKYKVSDKVVRKLAKKYGIPTAQKHEGYRPSKEELLKDRESLGWEAIGEKYSVEGSTARQWARKFGIPTEQQEATKLKAAKGYWKWRERRAKA